MSTEAFARELRARVRAGFRVIFVVTHEERRARAVVEETLAGAPIATWTSTRGLGEDGGATRDPEAALLRAATTAEETAFLFFDLHPFLAEPRVVRALRDFAALPPTTPTLLVAIGPRADVPNDLARDVAVLDLPLPDSAELAAILERARGKRDLRGAEEAMVRAARGLTAAEAERSFRLALPAGDDALRTIGSEKRRALRESATLELVDVDVDLDAVGGLDALKAWLSLRVAAFGDRAREFGLSEPRGMLVCGVQGCGKSLVTKAASRVLGLPLVRLDFAAIFGAPSPEGALREVFRVAEAIAPIVLWVDEIEKGLGETARGGSADRVFGSFLTWLQERRAPVFVSATANDVERLPPELARRGRFDEVFFVDLPGTAEREDILRIHLARRGRDPSAYPIADLARALDRFSGAELEQVVIAALFRAFGQGRELAKDDLEAAARDTIPLASLYEEKVQALRTWAESRARRASADRRRIELLS